MASKPSPQALRDDIARSFGGAVSLSARSARRADALYEHYVLGLVLRAARTTGASVQWCDVNDRPTNVVSLRGGPGHIWAGDWTHAEVLHDGRDVLEVHGGVMVQGCVGHQADVLVLPSGRGRLCRKRGDDPRPGDVELVAEAKYYGSTRVDLALARGVLGLHAELNWNPVCLVCSRDVDDSAVALLECWRSGVFGNVRPGEKEARDFERAVARLL